MTCECQDWEGPTPTLFGEHHRGDCPKFHIEKFPHLMYYEEAIDAWTFAPDDVATLISQIEVGEEIKIIFRLMEYTDAEISF